MSKIATKLRFLVKAFFLMLQTLKLNSEKRKMKKNKVW